MIKIHFESIRLPTLNISIVFLDKIDFIHVRRQKKKMISFTWIFILLIMVVKYGYSQNVSYFIYHLTFKHIVVEVLPSLKSWLFNVRQRLKRERERERELTSECVDRHTKTADLIDMLARALLQLFNLAENSIACAILYVLLSLSYLKFI